MSDRVCIDLNGVLDTYAGWQGRVTWHEPRPGAKAFLRALRARGLEVVVLTTREPAEARAWLANHGLAGLVSEVTDRKLPALAYVDDRAVQFDGDFGATLRALDHFRPHWDGRAGNDQDGGDPRG